MKTTKLILHARVPILKYTDIETDIKVDVCFEMESGLVSASMMRVFLRTLPVMKGLVYVLKHFMHIINLNDVFHGGISSYILQLMIIFHIQFQHTISSDPSSLNAGLLLYKFFEYYGHQLQYESQGLCIAHGSYQLAYYNKEQRGWFNPEKPYLLSIQDPIDPDHDVAVGSFGIRLIRRCFVLAYEYLTQMGEAGVGSEVKTSVSGNDSGLGVILKGLMARPYKYTTELASSVPGLQPRKYRIQVFISTLFGLCCRTHFAFARCFFWCICR